MIINTHPKRVSIEIIVLCFFILNFIVFRDLLFFIESGVVDLTSHNSKKLNSRIQIQRTTTLHEHVFGQMRWKKILFAMILRHNNFCLSPRGFNGISTCASVGILESDRRIKLQMFIVFLSQSIVWLPAIGDDSCSREDPVLDDGNYKILNSQKNYKETKYKIVTNQNKVVCQLSCYYNFIVGICLFFSRKQNYE